LNSIFQILRGETGYKVETKYVTNPIKGHQFFVQADITKTRLELMF